MCSRMFSILVLGLVFVFINNAGDGWIVKSTQCQQRGSALQCWKCSSEYDSACRDYFNITKIQQNRRYIENVSYGNRQQQPIRNDPHLEYCDEMFTASYGQKNVCLKRVQTSSHGMKIVNRECRLVSINLKAGECPSELTGQSNLEFCGTCDHDGCNSATSLKTNVVIATAVPVALLLLLRK